MSLAQYPRIGSSRDIVKKQARRPDQHRKLCAICKAVADREVWIEVDWFRGNDEGPVHACKEHRRDERLCDHTPKENIP